MPGLIKYDAACRAIAEAKSVDEVKDIRDRSEAMRLYARQAKNKTLEADAFEIRERAEVRLGEILKAGKDSGQISAGQPQKNPTREEGYSRVKLADAGIDYKLSSRAQKKAAMPRDRFESYIAEGRQSIQAAVEKVTKDIIKRADIAEAREAYDERKEQGVYAFREARGNEPRLFCHGDVAVTEMPSHCERIAKAMLSTSVQRMFNVRWTSA